MIIVCSICNGPLAHIKEWTKLPSGKFIFVGLCRRCEGRHASKPVDWCRVYVDTLRPCIARGNWTYSESCHLICPPGAVDELHRFALTLRLRRSWFQSFPCPHYDLTKSKRQKALVEGALEITPHELVAIVEMWRMSDQDYVTALKRPHCTVCGQTWRDHPNKDHCWRMCDGTIVK